MGGNVNQMLANAPVIIKKLKSVDVVDRLRLVSLNVVQSLQKRGLLFSVKKKKQQQNKQKKNNTLQTVEFLWVCSYGGIVSMPCAMWCLRCAYSLG
jgi:hypothetical protein